jgi:hypothetical protein
VTYGAVERASFGQILLGDRQPQSLAADRSTERNKFCTDRGSAMELGVLTMRLQPMSNIISGCAVRHAGVRGAMTRWGARAKQATLALFGLLVLACAVSGGSSDLSAASATPRGDQDGHRRLSPTLSPVIVGMIGTSKAPRGHLRGRLAGALSGEGLM